MNLNIINSLKKTENKQFTEFLNTLHYTYFLNINNESLSINIDDSEWIDEAFEKIEEVIQNLYHSKSNNPFIGVPYYDRGHCTNTGDPAFFQLTFSSDMWRKNIKYHTILSALYTITSILSADRSMTIYELANKDEGRGFFQKLFKPNSTPNKNDPSNLGNRISSQIETLKGKFSCDEYNTFIGDDSEDLSKRTICGFHSDIIWRLAQCRIYNNKGDIGEEVDDTKKAYGNNLFISLHKKFESPNQIITTEGMRIKDFAQMIKLIDKIQTILYDFDFENSDIYQRVDYLLYLYKLERFYNLSATRTLFEAIYDHNQRFTNSEDKLNGDSILTSFLEIFKLPNVFSREIFIKYLFESYENNLNDNFFDDDIVNNNIGILFIDASAVKEINKRHTWERLVQYFCKYFNNLVFPLVEGLFIALIINNFDFASEKNAKKCLVDLAEYLDQHFDDLLNPQYTTEGNIICCTRFKSNPIVPESFATREIGLSMFTDSSLFKKTQMAFYDEIFNFLLLNQSNIIHPDPDYKKIISRDSIKIRATDKSMQHKKLATFYVNEAINRK